MGFKAQSKKLFTFKAKMYNSNNGLIFFQIESIVHDNRRITKFWSSAFSFFSLCIDTFAYTGSWKKSDF